MATYVYDGAGSVTLSIDGALSILAPGAALAPAGAIGPRPRVGTAIVGIAKLGADHYELINDGVLSIEGIC